MNVLVLNCGSSSVKFQLIEMTDEQIRARGVVERIGSKEAVINYSAVGHDKIKHTREVQNHDVAIGLVLSTLLDSEIGVIKDKSEIAGIGHRVVHGGEQFAHPVLIDDEVIKGVQQCNRFAPLHNPHNLEGIRVCKQQLAGIPQVGVFDTAFHHTLPREAYMYALPMDLYRDHKIRRYGFHGTSHGYVAQKAAEYVDLPIEELKIITCHLGNGASITAVDGGDSVETSMGFTPLEGLVMGTRCGDIDPALVPYIATLKNLSMNDVDGLLNKKSGMLALTEDTNDMRDIEEKAIAGSKIHSQALDIYIHRLKKYIGAYTAVLGGLDILVFTAGIGEHSSYCRRRICADMEYLGIKIDPQKNDRNAFDIGNGRAKVLVVPTNEELAIARETYKILQSLTDR